MHCSRAVDVDMLQEKKKHLACISVRRSGMKAKGLTPLKSNNKAGFYGVYLNTKPSTPKPYLAQVRRGGKLVSLGSFATAQEAALCIARSPEGQAAAERAAAAPPPPPPLTSEEARQQAEAEGLTLLVAENKTGYFGVNLVKPGQPNPYQAEVRRGGKKLYLGSFATAEEAALCVARTPEGQAAAGRPAAAAPLTSEGARQQAQAEGLTLLVGRSGRGYFGVHHKPGKSKPYEAMVWRGGKTVHLCELLRHRRGGGAVHRAVAGGTGGGPAGAARNTVGRRPQRGTDTCERGRVAAGTGGDHQGGCLGHHLRGGGGGDE